MEGPVPFVPNTILESAPVVETNVAVVAVVAVTEMGLESVAAVGLDTVPTRPVAFE